MVTKKQDKKSDYLSVRIPPTLKERLVKLAAKKDRSLSWIIGRIIEKYLKEKDGQDL